MLATRTLLALVALIITAAGCAAPIQNGGVDVRPGAAERLEAMCRLSAAGSQAICSAAPEDAE